MLRFTNR